MTGYEQMEPAALEALLRRVAPEGPTAEAIVRALRPGRPASGPPYAPVRFDLDPVAKPRMTRRDQWKRRPAVVRYRDYCDRLHAQASALGFTLPEAGASIRFEIRMPKSWSQRKRREMERRPHQQKPDLDNLVKGVLDTFLPDDSVVWHLAGVEKRWARAGAIVVRALPAPDIDA